MSYVALGNDVGATCLRLQAEYDRDVYLPDKLCPENVGKTGHHPPRARLCSGGLHAVQTALRYAGLYSGPIDGKAGAGTKAALAVAMANQGTSWNGDEWSFGPSQCAALIREVAMKVPACPGTYPDVGCVIPPTGAATAPPPPPPPPPSGDIASKFKSTLLRRTVAPTPKITTADARLVRVTSSTEAGMEPEPPPAEPPVAPEPPANGGVPTWAFIAGGAVVVGGVAYLALRKKR